MRRFYFRSDGRRGDTVTLTGGEAHHLSVVVRARVCQIVRLFNEKGEEFVASVARIEPRRVELTIEKKVEAGPSPPGVLHLAVALVKGKALEKVLSSATELGVGRIVVVRCERSVPRVSPAGIGGKLARWKSIALSAAKQCGRSFPPEVEYTAGWNEMVGRIGRYDRTFIALRGGPREPFSLDGRERVLVMVGPEGGFTGAEESAALERGARPLSLGPFTLRSDTAAVAAVSLIAGAFWHCSGAVQ